MTGRSTSRLSQERKLRTRARSRGVPETSSEALEGAAVTVEPEPASADACASISGQGSYSVSAAIDWLVETPPPSPASGRGGVPVVPRARTDSGPIAAERGNLKTMMESDTPPAKPLKLGETAAADEETAGEAILDHAASLDAAMIALGRERACVTRDELDRALPPGEAGAANIEDAMTVLSGPGIAATEGREPEEDAVEARPEGLPAAASPGTAGDDPGRVDDLLAMYLRDMGGAALLTREGEVALAKRIEAGRRAVLDGLCGSLPAMRTVSAWRDAIHEGSLALRRVIDAEATYGGERQPRHSHARAEAVGHARGLCCKVRLFGDVSA